MPSTPSSMFVSGQNDLCSKRACPRSAKQRGAASQLVGHLSPRPLDWPLRDGATPIPTPIAMPTGSHTARLPTATPMAVPTPAPKATPRPANFARILFATCGSCPNWTSPLRGHPWYAVAIRTVVLGAPREVTRRPKLDLASTRSPRPLTCFVIRSTLQTRQGPLPRRDFGQPSGHSAEPNRGMGLLCSRDVQYSCAPRVHEKGDPPEASPLTAREQATIADGQR